MGKVKSFADKVAKSAADFSTHCPTCGEALQNVMLVTSEKSDKTGAWRFNQRYVGICKCNEKDLEG